MYYIGVDLGSTNLKAALYSGDLVCVARESEKVYYTGDPGYVELDILRYYDSFAAMIRRLLAGSGISPDEIRSIGFTGQAETLVVLGLDGQPLMNAISWMDDRSKEECDALASKFSPEIIHRTTGQMAVLPTWPATKILWLKNHRPEVYENAAYYLLLKDYLIYRMTGELMSDMSIATFSFYFDIYNKCYWQEMLSAIGIGEAQLPPLVEPNTPAGFVSEEAAKETGLSRNTIVNIGTLDHFAGMVGTGNITPGGVSLSTGTVMALVVMADKVDPDAEIAMHYGFLPDTWIMLPCCESGGASLEWLKTACMKDVSYDEMNRALAERKRSSLPVFLPYIVGTNAPEYDSRATGVFWGLRQEHDVIDMAGAVMDGVSCLLRKNCDSIRATGTEVKRIIATGGGAKSAVWCQMQADQTGLPVDIPSDTEAACLGAAIVGAVGAGDFADLAEACGKAVSMKKRYEPVKDPENDRRYRIFTSLYDATVGIADIR